jgi:penicillin amidase
VNSGGASAFVDDTRTPAREERGQILMRAFLAALSEVRRGLGDDPAGWAWGRVHTLELRHPIGRASRLLGPYFNRGPLPVPGHNSTVNKMEFDEIDFRVIHGPSMRQVTELGADLDRAWAVLPAGQSGLPASLHYDDLQPLWLTGRYHPFPLTRAGAEALLEARLVLEP